MSSFSYAEAFKKLGEENKKLFVLTGDCLLVEVMNEQKEIKTNTGIILAQVDNQVTGVYADRPQFCRVLLVGDGFTDGEEEVPVDVNVGDIILVGNHSIKRFSSFGALPPRSDVTIAMARASDIQMRFPGDGAYKEAFGILETEIKKKQ